MKNEGWETMSDLKEIKEMWQLNETCTSRLDPGFNQEKKAPTFIDNWWNLNMVCGSDNNLYNCIVVLYDRMSFFLGNTHWITTRKFSTKCQTNPQNGWEKSMHLCNKSKQSKHC